ncbi:MAG: M15 family metallopeptidase [Congregibacter sp.]
MSLSLFERQLLGIDESALRSFGDQRLLPDAGRAFQRLAAAASKQGFDLRIASSYRSYDRQLRIWNEKMCGQRSVCDDTGERLNMVGLQDEEKLHAVLRFSALPGASRHHWGTDVDVYDHAALVDGYQLQLSAAEVEDGGCFSALHDWLDERIVAGESFGFYRPYDLDRGGVARERWHLSFAPLATDLAAALEPELLRRCWRERASQRVPGVEDLSLRELVEPRLDALLERFVLRVGAPPAPAMRFELEGPSA